MAFRTQLILLFFAVNAYCQVPADTWDEMTTAQMRLQSDNYEESNVADNYGVKLSRKALLLHKDLAEMYLSSGEYTSALAKYNMLLTYEWEDGEKADLVSKKGACHEGLKQYDMALKSYLESADLQPKNAANRLNLARIYDITGMDGQAIVEYKKTIDLGGDRFAAASALGRLYERRGLFSKAAEYYSQALLVKSSPEIYGALSRCYEALSQWDLASSMLKQEMSSHPEAPPIESVVHLAYLYSLQKKYDEAVSSLLAARERDGSNEEIMAHLAAVYFKKGEYDKARGFISEYLAKNPGSALPHFLAGFMDYFQGRKDRAAGEMTKTVEMNPSPMLKEYAQYILAHTKQK